MSKEIYLYGFPDKTSDEVLYINGFTHVNQLIEAYNKLAYKNVRLQDKIDKAIELLSKGVTFCENDSQGNYDICNIAINREKKVLETLKGSENND